MRKFSKINESREDLISKIGTTKEELKDIFQELIDEGWEFTIRQFYLSLSGHTSQTPSSTKYYPAVSVELRREVVEGKDPREWDGGVYYEDNTSYLKMIYSAIGRCNTTVEMDGVKVHYSIRSINEINIRITSDIEESSIGIGYEDFLDSFDKNLRDGNIDRDYKIESQGHFSMERTIEIHVIDGKHHTNVKYFSDDICGDRILDNSLKYGNNNKIELIKHANNIVTKVFKGALGNLDTENFHFDTLDEYDNYGDKYITYIKDGKKIKLVKIEFKFIKLQDVDITVASGIFNNKVEKVSLYSLTLSFHVNEF